MMTPTKSIDAPPAESPNYYWYGYDLQQKPDPVDVRTNVPESRRQPWMFLPSWSLKQHHDYQLAMATPPMQSLVPSPPRARQALLWWPASPRLSAEHPAASWTAATPSPSNPGQNGGTTLPNMGERAVDQDALSHVIPSSQPSSSACTSLQSDHNLHAQSQAAGGADVTNSPPSADDTGESMLACLVSQRHHSTMTRTASCDDMHKQQPASYSSQVPNGVFQHHPMTIYLMLAFPIHAPPFLLL